MTRGHLQIRHQDRTLTVELLDEFSVDDNLRLDDFLEQMIPLKAALRETERLIFNREPSLYFRIVGLQKDSPPVITLEALSDSPDYRATAEYASHVVRGLTTNLRVISKRKRLPRKMDYATLKTYRELTAPAEKHHLQMRIRAGKHEAVINNSFAATIDRISGNDEFSFGSVSGTIEAINLHDRNRTFHIFPTVGPNRLIGTFRSKQRKLFASAVDRYVTVYGKLRYKMWDKFPYAINAESIEIHDMETYPSLRAIGGIAPMAKGDPSGIDLLELVEDEW